MALKLNIENLELPLLFNSSLGINDVKEVYIKITEYHGVNNSCRIKIDFFEYKEEVVEDVPLYDEYGTLVNEGATTTSFVIGSRLNIPKMYKTFNPIEDGSENDFNVRKQGYNYLKTLQEFEKCEDC